MLLGSEYEALSKIGKNYTWHSLTGTFQFSESDYKLRFPEDENLFYLNKIFAKGYANYSKGKQIIVNSVLWIEEFTRLIQKEIGRKGYEYTFEYELKQNTIYVKLKGTEVFKFYVNFQDEIEDYNNTISFVHVPTFNSYIYWLDLLNDPTTLDMFIAFLNKQIAAFNFLRRLRLSFFESLDPSYISEIFNNSIPDYFGQAGFIKGKTSDEQWQWLMKYYLKESLEAYTISRNNIEFMICKLDDYIEILLFDEQGNIKHSQLIDEEFDKLELKLREKITIFRRISMYVNNKATDNARRITQVAGTLLTPINLFILFGISPLGLTWLKDIINSIYSYIAIGLILVCITLGYIFWLVIPNVRLVRFNWKLEYDN